MVYLLAFGALLRFCPSQLRLVFDVLTERCPPSFL